MSRPADGGRPCLDIVRPFFQQLETASITDVQMMGGIGSAALSHPDLHISLDDKTISVPEGALDHIRQYRAKEDGGTLRDMDCLVLNTSTKNLENRRTKAESVIKDGEDLELSFFPLIGAHMLDPQAEHPVRSIFSTHLSLSDRYVFSEDGGKQTVIKAVFPFAVESPVETLDTFQLEIGGESTTIPVPHPGAVILNYSHRSISGLRPKDTPKVNRFVENIARVAPEIIDWVVDGPGASQLELSRLVYSLRSPRFGLGLGLGPKPLDLGGQVEIKPYSVEKLLNHPALNPMTGNCEIGGGMDPAKLEALIAAMHIKSAGLHFAEKQDWVVKLWQTHLEPRFDFLTKNYRD